MSMNFIDAAGVLADSADVAYHDLLAREAKSIVQATVDAYDALAPDWADAPEWAQWYTIDADGDGRFREHEPEIFREECRWYGIALEGHVDNDLPIGVDWRLCKWHRPVTEVTK